MNMDTLSMVEFGNNESLGEFLFENGLQHKLFQEVFMDSGISVPIYPIIDAETSSLDDRDWETKTLLGTRYSRIPP